MLWQRTLGYSRDLFIDFLLKPKNLRDLLVKVYICLQQNNIMTTYYLDSCVWLNLFQKETDWKNVVLLLTKSVNKKIYVSSIVLTELKHILLKKYTEAYFEMKKLKFVHFVKSENEDYDYAGFLEVKHKKVLSFADFLHIAISHRLGAILVTRDKMLINIANQSISAAKPEELIN